LEDIYIRQWRRQPQYGSSGMVDVAPPGESFTRKNGQASQPAHWLTERQRQEAKKKKNLEKNFEYNLY